MFLKRPFYLGSLKLPSNVLCAPLAGCSDLPFRRMLCVHQPGLVYCEMVKMDALIRHDPHTFRLLDYDKGMHPIGAQICGSKPQIAGKCAKIIEELGFDVVDLNCGCPVDKVTKDGSGSAMLKNPLLIGEVIAEMRAAVNIPVTVKIRAGWDDAHINAVQITQIAEQAGAVAICIHGRTREQGYSGRAQWDYITACKKAARHILIIGNGDIFDAPSAEEIFQTTGCDAILLSRGTMGQPWIVEDIYARLGGLPPKERRSEDYRQALLGHFEEVVAHCHERKAMLDMRRIGCWYLKRAIGARKLREAFNRAQTTAEIRQLILDFSWNELDFSGEKQCALN